MEGCERRPLGTSFREDVVAFLLSTPISPNRQENELELRHKEVADLLYATPLGLTDWDIKLLLTRATEFETGRPVDLEGNQWLDIGAEIGMERVHRCPINLVSWLPTHTVGGLHGVAVSNLLLL